MCLLPQGRCGGEYNSVYTKSPAAKLAMRKPPLKQSSNMCDEVIAAIVESPKRETPLGQLSKCERVHTDRKQICIFANMTIEAFKSSLSATNLPEGISILLQALWCAAKDDWETAHNIAQDIPSAEGSWIHAHLHRVEGDQGNAAYWYRRAGKAVPRVAIEEEWEDMVIALLANE